MNDFHRIEEKLSDSQNPSGMPHEILRFVLPGLRGGPSDYASRRLRHHYYYNPACTELVILRKEYGTMIHPVTVVYAFEVRDRALTVRSCQEYTREATTTFGAGYPYIKLPDAGESTEWEYKMSDEIRVCCRSSFRAGNQDILLVERRILYDDDIASDSHTTREHYVAGEGIAKIECIL